MQNVKTHLIAYGMALVLSACGGGGSSSDTETPTEDSGTVSVTVVSRDGSTSDGIFETGTGVLTTDGTTEIAVDSSILDGFDYIWFTDLGNAIIEETETVPTGSATYNGTALLRVTDTANSTVYEGSATTNLQVDFSGTDGSSLTYSDFEGTSQTGLDAAVDASGGTISIDGITTSAEGLSAGNTPTVTGFGSADFTDGTTSVVGLFAGPSAEEVGGSASAEADGGILTSIFAGQRD